MAKKIKKENVFSFLLFAHQHSSPHLKSHCLAFINAHRNEVMATEEYQSKKEEIEKIMFD